MKRKPLKRYRRNPVRIVPVYKSGKEHAQSPDGYIIHHDDRAVRTPPPPPEKVADEVADGE